jgi:hypothetical protein
MPADDNIPHLQLTSSRNLGHSASGTPAHQICKSLTPLSCGASNAPGCFWVDRYGKTVNQTSLKRFQVHCNWQVQARPGAHREEGLTS